MTKLAQMLAHIETTPGRITVLLQCDDIDEYRALLATCGGIAQEEPDGRLHVREFFQRDVGRHIVRVECVRTTTDQDWNRNERKAVG